MRRSTKIFLFMTLPQPLNKYSKPLGEVSINKKIQADIKRQEKLQKKMNENKQNQPEQGQSEPVRIGN